MKSSPASPQRTAAVDIGTNTILLLIAEIKGKRIKKLFEAETVVRLGEGLQERGRLSEEAMRRGIQTLSHYVRRCKAMKVQKIIAVGTSALREAKNSAEFLRSAKEQLDLSVEVISGEEEARLSYLAVAKDLAPLNNPILVVDVGGGSTEFILGRGYRIREWKSLPAGSVRFTEQFLHSDPVQEEEWRLMERKIRKLLADIPHPEPPLSIVAVGGTSTTLAAVEKGLEKFLPEKIHHFALKKEALRNQLLLYRSKTIEERMKIRGLPPSRADVILAGGAILYLTMEELGYSSVLISSHGVRYGLLYEEYTRR